MKLLQGCRKLQEEENKNLSPKWTGGGGDSKDRIMVFLVMLLRLDKTLLHNRVRSKNNHYPLILAQTTNSTINKPRDNGQPSK